MADEHVFGPSPEKQATAVGGVVRTAGEVVDESVPTARAEGHQVARAPLDCTVANNVVVAVDEDAVSARRPLMVDVGHPHSREQNALRFGTEDGAAADQPQSSDLYVPGVAEIEADVADTEFDVLRRTARGLNVETPS